MSIAVAERCFDLALDLKDKRQPCLLFDPGASTAPARQHLRLYCALAGETSPQLCPLPTAYTDGQEAGFYRYDWLLGVTPLTGKATWWEWWDSLRDERAVNVKLLFDSAGSGFLVNELAAYLLALQPSRDTNSWFERNAEQLGKLANCAATAAGPVNSNLAGLLNLSALMSNFVSSGSSRDKSWFLYRFLDDKLHCPAVEWNIHHKVLEQVGPLLRGSIVLSFHGQPATGSPKPVRLLLRPHLGFQDFAQLDYQPSTADIEAYESAKEQKLLQLEIAPV